MRSLTLILTAAGVTAALGVARVTGAEKPLTPQEQRASACAEQAEALEAGGRGPERDDRGLLAGSGRRLGVAPLRHPERRLAPLLQRQHLGGARRPARRAVPDPLAVAEAPAAISTSRPAPRIVGSGSRSPVRTGGTRAIRPGCAGTGRGTRPGEDAERCAA